LKYQIGLFAAVAILAISGACSSYYGYNRAEDRMEAIYTKSFINKENNLNSDIDKYHSAYKTGNSYYDGRNLILDGDLVEAVKVLSKNLDALDYPSRAALWIFLCKCRISDKKEAIEFLNDYVRKVEIDHEDESVISAFLLYYLGRYNDEVVLRKMDQWDELDNCAAYYYYGAYKKYYDGDLINGNLYIAKSMRTNISDYSEFKFSEKEIRGFTARSSGQYKYLPRSEEAMTSHDLEQPIVDCIIKDSSLYGNTLVSGEHQNSSTVEVARGTFPSNLMEGQYAVPRIDGESWEVVGQEELLQILLEETESLIDFIMDGKEYFTLFEDPEFQYIPASRSNEKYVIKFEDYLKEKELYSTEYGLEYNMIVPYLRKGDYISGLKMECNIYDSMYKQYGNTVFVTLTDRKSVV